MAKKIKNSELGRLDVPDFKAAEKSPITIVCDNIRSLNNVGSIFRTSDGFRVEQIILCGITACPPHRDIQKTALGATESIDWIYEASTLDAISTLKAKNTKCFALEQAKNSIPLDAFIYPDNQSIALVLGNEVEGVSQSVVDACDAVIEIPQYGTKHSFNVSVSHGICLW
ncbi:MAG: RNA methyltransferase, partial [Flavobacteriales bacterium]